MSAMLWVESIIYRLPVTSSLVDALPHNLLEYLLELVLAQPYRPEVGDGRVIGNNVATKEPKTYIMLPDEVRASAHRGEKDGHFSYCLQPAAYEKSEYEEAWGRNI